MCVKRAGWERESLLGLAELLVCGSNFSIQKVQKKLEALSLSQAKAREKKGQLGLGIHLTARRRGKRRRQGILKAVKQTRPDQKTSRVPAREGEQARHGSSRSEVKKFKNRFRFHFHPQLSGPTSSALPQINYNSPFPPTLSPPLSVVGPI